MAALDATKERIGYEKFWLGVVAVGNISLFSWLSTNIGHVSTFHALAGFALFCVGSVVAFELHRRIDAHINMMRIL
jgi:hypothetical protein